MLIQWIADIMSFNGFIDLQEVGVMAQVVVTDPRTGEIIKGHVSLGSLRVRQDFLIAQALMNKPFAERDDNYQTNA